MVQLPKADTNFGAYPKRTRTSRLNCRATKRHAIAIAHLIWQLFPIARNEFRIYFRSGVCVRTILRLAHYYHLIVEVFQVQAGLVDELFAKHGEYACARDSNQTERHRKE